MAKKQKLTPLGRWLEAGEGRSQVLAEALGVNRSQVSRWKHGIYVPEPERAVAISRHTGGVVTFEEILFPRGMPKPKRVRRERSRQKVADDDLPRDPSGETPEQFVRRRLRQKAAAE